MTWKPWDENGEDHPEPGETVLVALDEELGGSRYHTVTRMEIGNGTVDTCGSYFLRDTGCEVLYWRRIDDLMEDLTEIAEKEFAKLTGTD